MNAIRISLEEIHTQSEEDLMIDKDNLTVESVRTPRIFSKYSKMLSVEKIFLRKYQFELQSKEKDTWEYYTGKADPETYREKPFQHKVLKGNIDKYLDSDPELEKIRTKLDIQKEKVESLERILKAVNDRQWIIRNAIENQKFLSGL